MAETITIRTDAATERALDVLTHDGTSRSAAIRQAVLDSAARRERAVQMRRVADELARDLMITTDIPQKVTEYR